MGKQRARRFAEGLELSNAEISKLIDDYIRNERNRRILKRRLIDGVCFEPLAYEFDLSVRQVKNIVYKNQEKLFKKIEIKKNL